MCGEHCRQIEARSTHSWSSSSAPVAIFLASFTPLIACATWESQEAPKIPRPCTPSHARILTLQIFFCVLFSAAAALGSVDEDDPVLSFAVAWGGEVDVTAIDFLTMSFPAPAGQSGDHAAMRRHATVATQHWDEDYLPCSACHGWRAARRPPFSARRPAFLLRPGQLASSTSARCLPPLSPLNPVCGTMRRRGISVVSATVKSEGGLDGERFRSEKFRKVVLCLSGESA